MAAAAVIILTAAAVIYYFFDPSESAWFPRCPVVALTGFKCPGCGSQRMLHALLHGDFGAALHHNAMLLFMLPLIAVLIISEPLRRHVPRLYLALNSPWLIVTVMVAIAIWTIARNIFGV